MKHGTGESAIYTCDFCGTSNKGDASMFVSPLDKSAAICKPCVDGLPVVFGKVLTLSAQRPAVIAAEA